jgi:hypothetical protein
MRYPSGHRNIAIEFRVVWTPTPRGHQGLLVEGEINTGFEEHIKTCLECRAHVVKDLRDFAEQIEKGKL